MKSGRWSIESGTLRYTCSPTCASLIDAPLYEEQGCDCQPAMQVVALPMPPADVPSNLPIAIATERV